MNSKTEARIKSQIAEIEADPRYISGQEHPANVMINAGLALIQVSLSAQLLTLKRVLTWDKENDDVKNNG